MVGEYWNVENEPPIEPAKTQTNNSPRKSPARGHVSDVKGNPLFWAFVQRRLLEDLDSGQLPKGITTVPKGVARAAST